MIIDTGTYNNLAEQVAALAERVDRTEQTVEAGAILARATAPASASIPAGRPRHARPRHLRLIPGGGGR